MVAVLLVCLLIKTGFFLMCPQFINNISEKVSRSCVLGMSFRKMCPALSVLLFVPRTTRNCPALYKSSSILDHPSFARKSRTAHTCSHNSTAKNDFKMSGVKHFYEDISSSEDESTVEESSSEEESPDSETEYDNHSEINSSVWVDLKREAAESHKEETEDLCEQLMAKGQSDKMASVKAFNKMLPVFRKELRKKLLKRLQWMHNAKKDSIFKKIMNTKRDLMDSNADYAWKEAVQVAIEQRKFLLNDLFQPLQEPNEEEESEDQSYGSSYKHY